jgi:hypothetical protein
MSLAAMKDAIRGMACCLADKVSEAGWAFVKARGS